jgi:hypothetical protein
LLIHLIAVWLISAFALWIVAQIIPRFEIKGFGSAVVAAAMIAIVNTILGPVLRFLSFPITFLTLGLPPGPDRVPGPYPYHRRPPVPAPEVRRVAKSVSRETDLPQHLPVHFSNIYIWIVFRVLDRNAGSRYTRRNGKIQTGERQEAEAHDRAQGRTAMHRRDLSGHVPRRTFSFYGDARCEPITGSKTSYGRSRS